MQVQGTADLARADRAAGQVQSGRPVRPVMKPLAEDASRAVSPWRGGPAEMTFADATAALYRFSDLDAEDLQPRPVPELRAEVGRILAEHGPDAVRQAGKWIAEHGEGVLVTDPAHPSIPDVLYGGHERVRHMMWSRVQAGRLCRGHLGPAAELREQMVAAMDNRAARLGERGGAGPQRASRSATCRELEAGA
jgi:hypothetical protein